MRIAKVLLISLMGLILFSEISVRFLGFTDFPIYKKVNGVEYRLVENQSGRFLRRNSWSVNDVGFVNEMNFSTDVPSCLLVGDSVVYGGNPFDIRERVGALASIPSGRIWVASAGGWSLANELHFLASKKALLPEIQNVVFIINNGDITSAAPWTGELSFPTRKPSFATLYLIRRYLFPHPAELPLNTDISNAESLQEIEEQFNEFMEFYHGKVSIILYADQEAFENPSIWDAEMSEFIDYLLSMEDKISIVDSRKFWKKSYFRDSVHPNFDGNFALSQIVSELCFRQPV